MVREWPEAVQRVSSFLRQTGAEARIEEFQTGTPTAVDAARAAGCTLGQIVKSLVFDCDGRWVVALVAGAVAPFPLPKIDRVFVDQGLLAHKRVWVGAGSPSHMAVLSAADLMRLARAQPMDAVEAAT